MKGLSVFLTLVLLVLAIWLPNRLRAAGKLPADDPANSDVPALDLRAKARSDHRPTRL